MTYTDHLATASTLAPVVERVHGKNHPELTRVRELTEAIAEAQNPAAVAELFGELRSITDDYAIPADACEGFTAAYDALQAADRAQAS